MLRHRLLVAALLLVVGAGAAGCDRDLGGGFIVENHTDHELQFEVVLDTGPYRPVALAPAHGTATVITASHLNGMRCLQSGMVAYAPDGHVVARHEAPLCFGDRWVIDGVDESPSPSPSR